MKLPKNNRFSGFTTEKADGTKVVSVFTEGPLTPAEIRAAVEGGDFNLEGKQFLSDPPHEIERQIRRKQAGIMIAQCLGTTIGCTLMFNGLHNIIDSAHSNADDENRWTRAAVGAGKIAAGAAALYFTVVNPPRFMR